MSLVTKEPNMTRSEIIDFATAASNAGDDLAVALAYIAQGFLRLELPGHLQDALAVSAYRRVRKAGARAAVAKMAAR